VGDLDGAVGIRPVVRGSAEPSRGLQLIRKRGSS
jgi:hypothetical protein